MNKRPTILYRIIAFLMVLFCLLPFMSLSITAEAPDNSDAHIVLLYSFFDKAVLFEKNTQETIAPGATAKMMTALLAIEELSDLSRTVTLSKDLIAGNAYGATGFVNDAVVSLHDLVAALIIGNVNSAANILARVIAGDIDSFVEKMNRRAADLGMTDTVYKNPTGLDADGAITTAHDVLLLSLALSALPTFTDLAAMPRITLDTGKELYSQNYFLGQWITIPYYYKRATGMNAGHTEHSGHTLVASAKESDGKTYLCIVLGAVSASEKEPAYGIAKRYFQWAPDAFALRKVVDKATPLKALPVLNGDGTDTVACFAEKDVSALLPKDLPEKEIELVYQWDVENLTAPFEEGMTVGCIKVMRGENEIASCAIVTGSGVSRSQSAAAKDTAGKIFKSVLLFLLPILLFGLLIAVILILMRKKRRKTGS